MFAIGQENLPLFGMTMLAGSALALGLGGYRCARARIARTRIWLATALVPLLAVFLSHLLYCLVDVEYTLYTYSFGYLFAFWEHGYMVYGGILGAALALVLVGGKDRLKMLEQYAPSGALMLVFARVGEGFLGQGYGEYWYDESTMCRFPFMVFDAEYEAWAWALFMLEALVALVLFVALLTKKKIWQGDGALMLIGLYASAQIVLESLRRDEFLRWGFVRVEELLSAVVVLGVLICYCVKADKGKRLQKALCFGACVLMIVLCLLLEFATEGRIPFLEFLDVDGCYIAMACACAVLGACVLWMRHLCNAQYLVKGEKRAI